MPLTISLAQMRVARAQPDANLEKGAALVAEAARRGSELICFPEMWTAGFDWAANERMRAEHARSPARIAALAREHRIWINGSLPLPDASGRMANTSILFNPRGEQAAIYRKTHLFSFMHEDRHMAPGQALTVADTPWGPTGLSICYDIRFPELFRSYALKGARLTLSPMAFPYPRLSHWQVLVRARAIENQMFMIGVNQVGREDFGPDGEVTYFGHSCIIDPWGETVIEAGDSDDILLTAAIDLARVDDIRNRMTVLKDRRPELYELR